MGQFGIALGLLLFAALSANFASLVNLARFKPYTQHIPLWVIRVLLWLAGFFLFIGLGLWAEQAQGQIASQDWVFWVTAFLLYAVMSFPGLVYRSLWTHGQ